MNFKNKKSGQGMIEYILIVGLIVISSIIAISYFGKQEQEQFAGMTKALSGEDVIISNETNILAKEEAGKNPELNKYRVEKKDAPDTPPAPPPPAADPLPASIGIDSVRHHIGDGSFGEGLGGGDIVNEGKDYNQSFNIKNLQQAKDQGIEYALIKIDAEGIDRGNSIYLNNQPIASLANGQNTIKVPIDQFKEEGNKISIQSGSHAYYDVNGNLQVDYDDFEFSDIQVTWQK